MEEGSAGQGGGKGWIGGSPQSLLCRCLGSTSRATVKRKARSAGNTHGFRQGGDLVT